MLNDPLAEKIKPAEGTAARTVREQSSDSIEDISVSEGSSSRNERAKLTGDVGRDPKLEVGTDLLASAFPQPTRLCDVFWISLFCSLY